MRIYFDDNSWKNAEEKSYRLLPDIYKPKVVIKNQQTFFTARVVGAKRQIYIVKLWRESTTAIQADCSCKAGLRGLYCYHVASVYRIYVNLVKDGQMWSISSLIHLFTTKSYN